MVVMGSRCCAHQMSLSLSAQMRRSSLGIKVYGGPIDEAKGASVGVAGLGLLLKIGWDEMCSQDTGLNR